MLFLQESLLSTATQFRNNSDTLTLVKYEMWKVSDANIVSKIQESNKDVSMPAFSIGNRELC